MAAPDPEALFQQAERLVALAPGDSDTRRAISAAYYGVFHFICTQAACMVVGNDRTPEAAFALVYRSIDHGHLRATCQAVQVPRLEQRTGTLLSAGMFSGPLLKFAALCQDLQARRTQADYDPSDTPQVSEARLAIGAGRRAIDSFRAAAMEERNAFLILLLFKRR